MKAVPAHERQPNQGWIDGLWNLLGAECHDATDCSDAINRVGHEVRDCGDRALSSLTYACEGSNARQYSPRGRPSEEVHTSIVTRMLTRRTAIDLVVIALCAIVLASRIRTLVNEPRVVPASRVAQLMYNRMLALRIEAYAREYGRPAYYLDSVMAHLDSADVKIVSGLRTDLWGEPVHYFWTWCWFTVTSRAGRAGYAGGPWNWVTERYPWPRGVGRTQKCFGSW